jgi:hypothetical protein
MKHLIQEVRSMTIEINDRVTTYSKNKTERENTTYPQDHSEQSSNTFIITQENINHEKINSLSIQTTLPKS